MIPVNCCQIDVRNDVGIYHQQGIGLPIIGHVAEGAPGAQDLGLISCLYANAEVGAGHEFLDLMVVMVGIDQNGPETGVANLLDIQAQHRFAVEGQEGFGPVVGIRPEPCAQAGGENHGFHG